MDTSYSRNIVWPKHHFHEVLDVSKNNTAKCNTACGRVGENVHEWEWVTRDAALNSPVMSTNNFEGGSASSTSAITAPVKGVHSTRYPQVVFDVCLEPQMQLQQDGVDKEKG